MAEMTRIERVGAAVRGDAVDRVPISFWYHFPNDAKIGAPAVALELDFYRRYGPDFLKVMDDNPYPGEERGALTLLSDWKRIEPLTPGDGNFAARVDMTRRVREAITEPVHIIHTVFNPMSVAMKLSGNRVFEHLREDPATVRTALRAIAESQGAFCRELVAQGASGVFFAAQGCSYDLMTEAEYLEFAKPADLLALSFIKDVSDFNVLHIHGDNIMFDPFVDYPVQALNWADRQGPPSLAVARETYGGCVCGGLDHVHTLAHGSTEEIEAQVRDAIQQTGGRRLIVGPGCAPPSDTPETKFWAALNAARMAGA